ncbi:MAG TPA: Cof-type HAD-IIB family hydrolase [Verrucomicrobiae bacterium]|jgi:Cof subfamily protein (haloacid dehalogenase superfamily)|nr:Cof-type HAD-IIB family hydrolase [Verrucomicrobiae bacterium]
MTTKNGHAANPIKMVIADVDGTLVTQEKVLTKRAAEAVLRLHDAGIQFSVTSGRPPRGMEMLIEPLKLVQPLAAFNGGVLIQPDLVTVVDQNFLPAGVPEQVIDSIEKHGLDVWIYTATDWFVRDVNGAHVAREQWTVKFPPKVVKTFDGLLGRVAKIVGVSDDLAAVAKCEKDVQQAGGSHISAARSQPYYLDVTHPKANKGEVVLAMSKLLNIPAEQMATLGDMPNDVLMFKKSGVSIAMGNASKEVQASATYVTATNEDEGFAKAIEEFVLNAHAAKA